MKKKSLFQKRANGFSGSVFFLMVAGLAINLLFSRVILYLKAPLFLDSIGTVLAAALGGYLPGIVVGFMTNVVNGLSDPITLYYGMVSLLIGVAAADMTRRYAYAKFGTAMLTSIPYALLGGGLGSVLTWLLYGFRFGTGVSAPFAVSLFQSTKLPLFWAQLIADLGIDMADKLATVLIVFFALRAVARRHADRFPNEKYLRRPAAQSHIPREQNQLQKRRFPLRNKIIAILVCASVTLCSAAITISFLIYRAAMTNQYFVECGGIVEMMRGVIDGDEINRYLATGKEDDRYAQTERQLIQIKDCFPIIEYLYVYQIREDGCHVVFDLDTPDLPGEPLGSLVPFDESFAAYRERLLRGEAIEPLITNDSYGWLMTVYQPVSDSGGNCVAYAAADIGMENVIAEQYVFIIRMISLLFGMTILILFGAAWFADKYIVSPINAMTQAAGQFAYDTESDRKKSTARIEALRITTGDEIENLYQSMLKTVVDFSRHLSMLSENAKTISNLHRGMILSFADIVESRDSNTGEHIRRTSAYVKAIAEELKRQGMEPELLTDAYIESLEENAPLHDIGKACIPDSILNKPGKLTPEEFARMKTHTLIGRQFLMDASKNIKDEGYFREAINMACYHHERWDGTGYPEGLSNRQIPLSARIMAVADVFDALVSKRSYKDAYSFEKAISIIKEESGMHFDPDVVDAFVRISPQILAILRDTADGQKE